MGSSNKATMFPNHPYRAFLKHVNKPTRYTGSEHGSVRKDWTAVKARVCLAFPDIYDIGMSHLGFRILYRILNDDERTLAERCYAPWVDMHTQLLQHGKLLVSLESARPLCDFDVVGFSLQYELTYTNILAMLDLGGIPLRTENRSEDDPLVIAGGPVGTHMEPMAPFLDAVLIGDGEAATTEIALSWTASKASGLPRRERLKKLSQIEGVYVPSLYHTHVDPESELEVVSGPECPEAPFPVRRRLEPDLKKYPFPDDGPVGGPEAIFDRMSIEIARGCTEGCRFCQAGMIYRPVRERDPKEVIETCISALNKTGQDELSLTALSTADVSAISPLIKQLVAKTAPQRISLGVASLRAYGLAEDLLDDLRKVRASGLTFAPEAGTQRMRDVINKNVTEEQLLQTAERVFSRGFDKMKLYFILGLPTEEDEDVLGIASVGKNALAVGRRLGKRPKVTVSVSTHVPKPHTPFQWCAMDPLSEVRRKQDLLRQALKGHNGLTLRTHDSITSVLEGILARGDRRLAPVIERAYLNGARFDSWEDQLKVDVWDEALEHFRIRRQRYLGTLPTTARLPWDHIHVGLEEGFLAREYRRALRNRLSPPCGKPKGMFVHHRTVEEASVDARKLVCYHCGVACDLDGMREERLTFLSELGAHEPARPRLPLAPAPEAAEKRALPEAFRPPQPGGPPERWRLRFAKLGWISLLGHLDLMRELSRTIRRAGIAHSYTRGFHPKPNMSFAPALALGVFSVDEYVDVQLIAAPDETQLLSRLNAAAPVGLRFDAARKLLPEAPGFGKLITEAHYVLALDQQTMDDLGGSASLERKLAEFLAEDSVVVLRNVKGISRKVDVRKSVRRLSLGGEREKGLLLDAGLLADGATLSVALSVSPAGSAKLAEVVQAVTGRTELPYAAVRTRLLADALDLLDERFASRFDRLPQAPVAETAPARLF